MADDPVAFLRARYGPITGHMAEQRSNDMDQPQRLFTGKLSYDPDKAVTVRLAGSIPAPTMTAEECVEHGGHCHVRTGFSRPGLPPQYQEQCKHCGHVRWAVPREAYEYQE